MSEQSDDCQVFPWYCHRRNHDSKTLYGGAGSDLLYGGYGDDTLDGGTGIDFLTGGGGNDIFVIRTGDGSDLIAEADIVTDFSDGTDLIGLDNNLTFSELTIEQGTGSNASDTLISVTATGEYLLILQNTTASDITDLDFTDVDVSASSRNAANKDDTTKDGNSIIPPETDIIDDDDNTPPDIDLPDWSLFVESLDLDSIILPETVVASEDIILPDLSDLMGLLGDQGDSLALDFDAVDSGDPVVAVVETVKPVIIDWISHPDPFIDTDWNSIIEELFYTSELG